MKLFSYTHKYIYKTLNLLRKGDFFMAVFRIEKNKDYTVMSNYHLRDKNLTFKAKGMLSFMLSLPDNWDYSLSGLCSVSKEGITSIRSTLNELEKFKYLKIKKVKDSKGLFEYEYYIYEYPYDNNPDIGFLHLDIHNMDTHIRKTAYK